MPHVVLDKAGDQDQSSGAQNLVDTHTHKRDTPNSLINAATKGRRHCGCWKPKEGQPIEPGVREDFLEEVGLR